MQKQHIEAFLEPLLGRHRSELAVVAHAPLIHVTRSPILVGLRTNRKPTMRFTLLGYSILNLHPVSRRFVQVC